jgi:signal peptidase I
MAAVFTAVAVVVIAGLGCTAVLRHRFLVVTVRGFSMMPTLHPGDRVLVRRCRAGEVRPGDVVAMRVPDGSQGERPPPESDPARSSRLAYYLKRVAAVAGDPVPAGVPGPGAGEPAVPEGMLVLLGDAAGSVDSRQWGPVSGRQVVGVVVRRVNMREGK